MHDKRWDCTSLEHAPKFKRDLRKGTQERAFVHSLSSAAVAINVARVCALGVLKDCNCAHRPQDDDLDENKVSVHLRVINEIIWQAAGCLTCSLSSV